MLWNFTATLRDDNKKVWKHAICERSVVEVDENIETLDKCLALKDVNGNTNFEDVKIATRFDQICLRIYLGIGIYSGDTQWLKNTNTHPHDYEVMVMYCPDVNFLKVNVADKLQGKICGQLGNYNGYPEDDF